MVTRQVAGLRSQGHHQHRARPNEYEYDNYGAEYEYYDDRFIPVESFSAHRPNVHIADEYTRMHPADMQYPMNPDIPDEYTRMHPADMQYPINPGRRSHSTSNIPRRVWEGEEAAFMELGWEGLPDPRMLPRSRSTDPRFSGKYY
jgi:hypothetical protein